MRSGRSSSSSPTPATAGSSPPTCSRCSGVADAEQLFDAVQAIVERDGAQALRAAARLGDSGRDPGQVLRDLEVHGRELLAVQVLDEVPPELRVTPERDRRLSEQAAALQRTDAVRLLDLVSTALEATTNGADARIQLELVLVKAAMPELDPSVNALLSRIERLEAGTPVRAPVASAAAPVSEPAAPAPAEPVAPPAAAPAPAPAAPARAVASSGGGGAAQPARVLEPDPEPEAAPEPEPALAPAAAAPLGLEDAERLWPAVVDTVRQENAMLAALLADARAVEIGERELTLAFPTGAAFLKRKAEQDDNRRMATQAWRTISGHALSLRYELKDVGDQPAGSPAMSGEELVRRFIEEFDAEEIVAEDLDAEALGAETVGAAQAEQPKQEQDA